MKFIPPWVYVAAGVVFVVLVSTTLVLRADLARVKLERDNAVAAAKAADEVLIKERQEAKEQNDRLALLQADKRAADEELERLTDCVANLTCGVRVKTVRITVPQADPGAAGTPRTDAGHCEISGQDYRDLRAAIALTEVRYKALQRELIARSSAE